MFYRLPGVYQDKGQTLSDNPPALAPHSKARILDTLEHHQTYTCLVLSFPQLKYWLPSAAIAVIFLIALPVLLYTTSEHDSGTISGIDPSGILQQISSLHQAKVLSTNPKKAGLSNLLGESIMVSEISSLHNQARQTAVFLMERLDPGFQTEESTDWGG
jgi:hypothetical protein